MESSVQHSLVKVLDRKMLEITGHLMETTDTDISRILTVFAGYCPNSVYCSDPVRYDRHIILAQRNTYTGPADVMFCAKHEVFSAMARNQAKALGKCGEGTQITWKLYYVTAATEHITHSCRQNDSSSGPVQSLTPDTRCFAGIESKYKSAYL